MTIEFRVLGPLEVSSDGQLLELGSRKQRTILAVLVANAGNGVSVDRCLQAGWGEDAPDGAIRSLHTYISNLRSIIDPDRTGIVEGLDGSYRLNLADDTWIDWLEFERLVASDTIKDLEAALDMWRGRPFQDVEDDWARPLATSWEERRLTALESWAAAMLETGDTSEVVSRLEQFCDEYPLHERVWSQLMLALYRSGRQADALSAYRVLKDRLAEDLGIDPSPPVRELEERILMQDPSLTPRQPPPTNVPSQVSEVVGRTGMRQKLESLLANTRLLTITGAAGVGKTTTAKDLARSQLPNFPDGVWWFELAPLRDPTLIVSEMLGAMRLPPATSQHPLDHMCRMLSDSSALLVLDNCEHLLDSVAHVVNALLEAGDNLKMLTTTREPLMVSGELTWTLPPLSIPSLEAASVQEVVESEAGALFGARARQADAGFDLSDDNASRVAAICRRLDGLPFAIELAAARLRSMGLAELEGRLDDRFRLLTGGSRSEVPHHQTLRGTLEWSFDLLDDHERDLYEDLSVFRGGFDSEAAQSVSSSEDTFDLLDGLVANSLLVVHRRGDKVRYSMLETIREHAAESLGRSGRGETVWQAHLSWIADMVREGARELEGKDGPVWISRFRRETDNIRAALSYAAENDPVTGAAICGGLSRYWFTYATDRDVTSLDDTTSFLEEGRRWSELMLNAEESMPPKIRARLLTALGGLLLIRLGRFDEAIECVREARQLWEELGDVRGQAWAVFYEGTASWSMIPIEETIELFDQAHRLHDKVQDPFGSNVSKMLRGMGSAFAGQLPSAREDFEACATGAGETGSPWLIAHADDNLAVLSILEGGPIDEAVGRVIASIEGFRSVPNYACLCHTIQTAGMILASKSELESAAQCLGVVKSIRDRLGMALPPYEDRTFWIEEMGLDALDRELRNSAEISGLAKTPDEGIRWVLDTLERHRG